MHEAAQIWETLVWFPEPSHDEKRDLPLIAIPKPLRRSGSVLQCRGTPPESGCSGSRDRRVLGSCSSPHCPFPEKPGRMSNLRNCEQHGQKHRFSA